MQRIIKAIALGMVAALAFLCFGCAWGPCGPRFVRTTNPQDDAVKQEAQGIARQAKDLPTGSTPSPK